MMSILASKIDNNFPLSLYPRIYYISITLGEMERLLRLVQSVEEVRHYRGHGQVGPGSYQQSQLSGS